MAMASTVPDDYAIPEDVLEITGPGPVPIWLNEMGGLTVRFSVGRGGASRSRYLKRNELPNSEDLALEAEKLEWLNRRHPAPRVLDHVRGDGVEYLITEALPGTNAIDPLNVSAANRTITEIGRGLRMLHDLPIDDCPWTWSIEERTELLDAEAAARLGPTPSIDRLVVSHGDPCAPNTLLGDDGRFIGHVDMQRLGVADRWADLAVTTMSFGWNYPSYDEKLFWEAYGLEPDRARIHSYRELWNAE